MSGLQASRPSDLQATRPTSLQASRSPGLQATRPPGFQASRPPGLQAYRPPGLEGSRPQPRTCAASPHDTPTSKQIAFTSNFPGRRNGFTPLDLELASK